MKEITSSSVDSNLLLQSASHFAAISDLVSSEDTACNGFGVIKDVKITNILSTDADKTEQFQSKNFKHIFGPSAASTPQSWSFDVSQDDCAKTSD